MIDEARVESQSFDVFAFLAEMNLLTIYTIIYINNSCVLKGCICCIL